MGSLHIIYKLIAVMIVIDAPHISSRGIPASPIAARQKAGSYTISTGVSVRVRPTLPDHFLRQQTQTFVQNVLRRIQVDIKAEALPLLCVRFIDGIEQTDTTV